MCDNDSGFRKPPCNVAAVLNIMRIESLDFGSQLTSGNSMSRHLKNNCADTHHISMLFCKSGPVDYLHQSDHPIEHDNISVDSKKDGHERQLSVPYISDLLRESYEIFIEEQC